MKALALLAGLGAGAVVAMSLALYHISRPSWVTVRPPGWDEPEDGVQPLDPRVVEFLRQATTSSVSGTDRYWEYRPSEETAYGLVGPTPTAALARPRC